MLWLERGVATVRSHSKTVSGRPCSFCAIIACLLSVPVNIHVVFLGLVFLWPALGTAVCSRGMFFVHRFVVCTAV